MTAIKYILKMILKLAALPVILILRIAILLAKTARYDGSYILSGDAVHPGLRNCLVKRAERMRQFFLARKLLAGCGSTAMQ